MIMQLPKEFIIHGHTIKVNLKEISKDNNYGEYNDATEEINIYKKIKVNDEEIILSDVQIQHTFFHELLHVFQWHTKGEYDEQEAQSYAGLLIEFFNTAGIKISPNIIHVPSNSNFNENV